MTALEEVMITATEANFDAEVVERSHEVPVLVDFWAPWCGPCRVLAPTLEKLAVERDGAFILVKVNTEEQPGLGRRFQIRSIPAVKMFHRGKVVGQFVGSLPRGEIERFLQTHLPSEKDILVAEGRKLLAAGHTSEGREKLREALEVDASDGEANLALARLALRERDATLVEHHLEAIDPRSDAFASVETVRAAAGFIEACASVGEEQGARQRLASNEKDLDARIGLGCCLALDERWPEALEELLLAVQQNNRHNDGAARKAMVAIFDLVGRKTDLVDEYVRKLQIYT